MKVRSKVPAFLILVLVLTGILFALPNRSASADIGPKPSLKIQVTNAPDELCYLDLLYTTTAAPDDLYQNIRETKALNQAMLAQIRSFETESKKLAILTGTLAPTFGNSYPVQRSGPQTNFDFGYIGMPKTFQIVLVSESGYQIISPEVTRERFYTTMRFDAATGVVTQTPLFLVFAAKFISTLIPTLLIEGLVLLWFRFNWKDNRLVFLAVNLTTQLALHGTFIAFGSEYSPAFFFLLVPLEVIIMIVESIAYAFLLKGHKVGRRIAYGVVANLISFVLGFSLSVYTDEIINTF